LEKDDITLQNNSGSNTDHYYLRCFANLNNALVLATSNRSEGVGYTTMDGERVESISTYSPVDNILFFLSIGSDGQRENLDQPGFSAS